MWLVQARHVPNHESTGDEVSSSQQNRYAPCIPLYDTQTSSPRLTRDSHRRQRRQYPVDTRSTKARRCRHYISVNRKEIHYDSRSPARKSARRENGHRPHNRLSRPGRPCSISSRIPSGLFLSRGLHVLFAFHRGSSLHNTELESHYNEVCNKDFKAGDSVCLLTGCAPGAHTRTSFQCGEGHFEFNNDVVFGG